MTEPIVIVLWALAAFQIKHVICDFMLQTRFQVENKGFYGGIGGITHAGLHVAFSIPALMLLTRSVVLIAPALLFEFVVHYHTDWYKARLVRLKGWNTQDNIYWIAFGLDQFVHQITYIAMVSWVLLRAPG
jgi:hypothetical protein